MPLLNSSKQPNTATQKNMENLAQQESPVITGNYYLIL